MQGVVSGYYARIIPEEELAMYALKSPAKSRSRSRSRGKRGRGRRSRSRSRGRNRRSRSRGRRGGRRSRSRSRRRSRSRSRKKRNLTPERKICPITGRVRGASQENKPIDMAFDR